MPRSSNNANIDRREFITTTAVAAATALLPLASIAHAAPVENAVTGSKPLQDWTIDDMWNVYPRYADPIAYGRALAVNDVPTDPLQELLGG